MVECAIIQNMKKTKRIFLDYAAITPIDPKVETEMLKAQRQNWANPSSLHQEGEQAKKLLEDSRTRIARILHCRANEVFFTSGGTESLNIAIFGVVKESHVDMPHIICSSIEHPAVLEPIKNLIKNKRAEVSFINPNENGLVSPESVRKEIKENTILVIIQHANNEIGAIQPIRQIRNIIENCKPKNKPHLLVDASQSALYEDISLERLGADILVFDGIKIYGPRGAGVLVVKHGTKISSVTYGGGQEGGLRPGTENVPNAAGLAKALEIAVAKRDKESKRVIQLRDYTVQKILKEIPSVSINGGLENRLPNNINICLPGQDSEFLVIKLDTLGFAVSAASACHVLTLENGSYVIENIGKKECASSSLRITLGRDTKKSDSDHLISALKKITK